MASAIKKVNKITQIVRLRQVVQRWKTKSLKRTPPPGSLAVYVGPELRRFVIPTRFLNLPVFVGLLDKAEEEFGFQTPGGLVLPCDDGFFREILNFLQKDEEKFGGLGLDEFLKMISEVGFEPFDQSYCKESSSSASSRHRFSTTPLLQKTRV
ncbi:SAUR-like auxin-responsive protein family [Abeliophyllum distichum]|uniref:SAUR-like auxin-responsive protein family n=1 Tax=Abeliophyllum distichum TaxID=126358 RepID=A0ABD1R085_9LAMI